MTPHRIYDQSYAAFFETLEAQGRSLLRFLHVSFHSVSYIILKTDVRVSLQMPILPRRSPFETHAKSSARSSRSMTPLSLMRLNDQPTHTSPDCSKRPSTPQWRCANGWRN